MAAAALTVSVSWRGWWWLNGHLMRERGVSNKRGNVTWRAHVCVFCGKHSHQV